MQTIWLILNRGSRAVGDDWESKLVAAFEARGSVVVGTSDFPAEPLPPVAALVSARVDTVAVAAGDGTINAAAHAYDDWDGTLLVLPGGTMNLLAKALHGDALPSAIIEAIAHPLTARPLGTVETDVRRALVGVIVGPAARWVHMREAVRRGRLGRLVQVTRLGWERSLSRAVRLISHGRRSSGYRAVFLAPRGDTIQVVKVSAKGWTDGVRLGFSYLTGAWETARGVAVEEAATITLAEARPTFALFDGEPVYLPPGATLRAAQTRLKFVTTA